MIIYDLREFGVTQTIRHHSPARDPAPNQRVVKPILPAFFLRKDVNSRHFMSDPLGGLDETRILPKSGHSVSTERYLCSKTSYFTVGALMFLIKIGKSCHSRTKRLVSALPKCALFTVGALFFRQMCSTLAHNGHFGPTSKNLAIYVGCAHFS